jgi:hypothetical protein
MNEVQVFINRLKKIGITLELMGNYPWIYLNKVNGNKIESEDWVNANHGYCIAWSGVKLNEEPHLNWYHIKKTFELIRKYK